MKSRALQYGICILLLGCACAQQTDPADVELRAAPEPDERLTLSSPRRDYLLGEPVQLRLRFRNNSKKPIKTVQVFVGANQGEGPLWIARNGDDFTQFPRWLGQPKRTRRVIPLEPGEELTYDYRAVAEFTPELRLAFPKAGEYRVYAVYPLWLWGAQKTDNIASNAVDVRIKEPAGDDANVWQQLNDPPLLGLLQTEYFNERQPDAPMKMAKLLRSHPASGYSPALRHALGKIYFRHRFGLPREDQERLAQTLGIANVETLADDRLEARRTAVLEKAMPVGQILASLTKLNVDLDAAPDLSANKVAIPEAYSTIRNVMRWLSDELGATWERRGNGYYLVPFDPATPRRAKVKD